MALPVLNPNTDQMERRFKKCQKVMWSITLNALKQINTDDAKMLRAMAEADRKHGRPVVI